MIARLFSTLLATAVISAQFTSMALAQEMYGIHGPIDSPEKITKLELHLLADNRASLAVSIQQRTTFDDNGRIKEIPGDWVSIRGTSNGGFLILQVPPTIVQAGEASQVIVVPLNTGGATPNSWRDDLVFGWLAGRYKYVGEYHNGDGKIGVMPTSDDLVFTAPDYARSDAMCCSHAWFHTEMTVRRGRLITVRRWIAGRP